MCQSAGLRIIRKPIRYGFEDTYVDSGCITSDLSLEKMVLPHWSDEKRPICEYVDEKVKRALQDNWKADRILRLYRSEFKAAFKNPLVNDSDGYIEPRVIGVLTYYAPYLSLFKKFNREARYITATEDNELKQSCMMKRLKIMSEDVYASIMKYIQSDVVLEDSRTLKQALRDEYVKRFGMEISFSNRIINGFLIPALVNRTAYLILANC